MIFRLPECNVLAIDRVCLQYTVHAHVLLMLILSACLTQPVVIVVQVTATQSRTDCKHTRGSRSTLFVSCLKTVTPHRAVSYVVPHLSITPTPGTCTPSLSSTQSSSHPLFSQLQPCADQRPHLSGALAEHPFFRGYEPKQLAERQDHRRQTLFFHRPSTASTYDSAESIVTPPHNFLLHRRVFTCCQSVQSHVDMHLLGSSHEAHCLRFTRKRSHLILIAECRTPCRT